MRLLEAVREAIHRALGIPTKPRLLKLDEIPVTDHAKPNP